MKDLWDLNDLFRAGADTVLLGDARHRVRSLRGLPLNPEPSALDPEP